MPFNKDKFLEKISAPRPIRYDMRTDEMSAIYDACHHSPFAMLVAGFNFGFIRGQQASKAKSKGQQKARVTV